MPMSTLPDTAAPFMRMNPVIATGRSAALPVTVNGKKSARLAEGQTADASAAALCPTSTFDASDSGEVVLVANLSASPQSRYAFCVLRGVPTSLPSFQAAAGR